MTERSLVQFLELSVCCNTCGDNITPSHLCHVKRAFSLLEHIVTHDCLNMSNETLHHLAIMYVNKIDKKRICDEEE